MLAKAPASPMAPPPCPGTPRPSGYPREVQRLYNFTLDGGRCAEEVESILGASPSQLYLPSLAYREHRPGDRHFDQKGDADDWFNPGAEEPMASIEDDDERSKKIEEEKYHLKGLFENDGLDDFLSEKPECFEESRMSDREDFLEVADGKQWRNFTLAPNRDNISHGDGKASPAFVTMAQIQHIPTAAEIETPRDSPESKSTEEVFWHPRPFGPVSPRTVPTFPNDQTSPVSARWENEDKKRRPTRPESSVYSWKRSRRQSSTSTLITAISLPDPGLESPDSRPAPNASDEEEDNKDTICSIYTLSLPSPLPEGKGPFWEKFEGEDYSNYVDPQLMTRDELLDALKEQDKRVFKLEMAASRDSWKIKNTEEELSNLNDAIDEMTENVASLERKVELLKSFLSIAGKKLRGMKEKRAIDCKRLNVAQQQLEKIFKAHDGYCASGAKRKFEPMSPGETERARENREDYIKRRRAWEDRNQRFRSLR
ncbi:uncharacterized protein BDV17DRAFT_276394 [Aspergillus undulatus]|uniref:uncharacterized protein n=1 Tax=Aspergillus undulatus TaxID=1810928 RepID=UPI003CCDBDC3